MWRINMKVLFNNVKVKLTEVILPILKSVKN